MPDEKEREAKKRGGIERWRTLTLPSGRNLHLAVTPEAGPRGGHTLAMAEGGIASAGIQTREEAMSALREVQRLLKHLADTGQNYEYWQSAQHANKTFKKAFRDLEGIV